MTKVARQHAELRVALKRGSEYALFYRATMTGSDLYCSVHHESSRQDLRSTYHESGKAHTYIADGAHRIDNPTQVPLVDFKGSSCQWSGSTDPDQLTWDYKPKADKRFRKTLIVDLEGIDLWIVDLWIIERYRLDLVTRALDKGKEFRHLGHVSIDWTRPWLYAIAWAATDEMVKSMYDSLPSELRGGKFTSVVLGPGPPVGPMRQFPVDDASGRK